MIITAEMIKRLCDEGLIERYHGALARGYVSRKSSGYARPYKGKFGEGFILDLPCWKSTQYKYIEYFIFTH